MAVTKPSRSVAGATTLALALFLAPALPAQDSQGITVTGVGRLEVKPSHLDIYTEVSVTDLQAADAIELFRESKKKALAGLERLALDGLTLLGEGVTISTSATLNPQGSTSLFGQQQPDPGITVAERMRLTLSGIGALSDVAVLDRVRTIFNVLEQLGLPVGVPDAQDPYQVQRRQLMRTPLVTFRLPEDEAVRTQVYQKAVANARENAQRLADLAGVKLGGIASIVDRGVDRSPPQQTASFWGIAQLPEEQPLQRIELAPVALKVKLTVVFAIDAS